MNIYEELYLSKTKYDDCNISKPNIYKFENVENSSQSFTNNEEFIDRKYLTNEFNNSNSIYNLKKQKKFIISNTFYNKDRFRKELNSISSNSITNDENIYNKDSKNIYKRKREQRKIVSFKNISSINNSNNNNVNKKKRFKSQPMILGNHLKKSQHDFISDDKKRIISHNPLALSPKHQISNNKTIVENKKILDTKNSNNKLSKKINQRSFWNRNENVLKMDKNDFLSILQKNTNKQKKTYYKIQKNLKNNNITDNPYDMNITIIRDNKININNKNKNDNLNNIDNNKNDNDNINNTINNKNVKNKNLYKKNNNNNNNTNNKFENLNKRKSVQYTKTNLDENISNLNVLIAKNILKYDKTNKIILSNEIIEKNEDKILKPKSKISNVQKKSRKLNKRVLKVKKTSEAKKPVKRKSSLNSSSKLNIEIGTKKKRKQEKQEEEYKNEKKKVSNNQPSKRILRERKSISKSKSNLDSNSRLKLKLKPIQNI